VQYRSPHRFLLAFRIRSCAGYPTGNTDLRIAQAYVKLLCIPEGSSEASVSLAWIGNCEIRIFEGSQASTDGMPLFWLELFDHRAKTSVDTFSCNEIEDAAVVFEDFIAQANDLNAGSDGVETQS
jgi:hypothetical protein